MYIYIYIYIYDISSLRVNCQKKGVFLCEVIKSRSYSQIKRLARRMGWLDFITSCLIAGTKNCHISVILRLQLSKVIYFYERKCRLAIPECIITRHKITFKINQPSRCNNFSSFLLDVYVQINIFRASSRPLSGAKQLQ